ncbi:ERF family protein [Exiguobacterium antarcticum]|uniref:ERF family protein n=1 Tax=Exiguobacterium antarcticum TaxID=132920 RepID=UPI00068F0F09|nr:ERF family protein [Exiguobacterium antarcticum]
MSEPVTRSLVKKLAEVMSEVKRVPKNGFNKFHKYQYATESDVSDLVRGELAKRSVMLFPSVISHESREHKNRSGSTEYISTIEMEFTFVDGESGETMAFKSVGEGQDAGDKAYYKAMTGATKYALMKVFLISTGDDPEADSKVDERNSKATPPKMATKTELDSLIKLADTFAALRSVGREKVLSIVKWDGEQVIEQARAVEIKEALVKWIDGAKKEAAEANKEESA